MKKGFMRKIVWVITLVVIVVACTSRKGGSEVFPKDFFGVKFGDDSATVKKKWREAKMYQGGEGRHDWLLHFRRRPEGYVSFGGAVWEYVDAIFDEDGRLVTVRMMNSYGSKAEAMRAYDAAVGKVASHYGIVMREARTENRGMFRKHGYLDGKNRAVLMSCSQYTTEGGHEMYNVRLEFTE